MSTYRSIPGWNELLVSSYSASTEEEASTLVSAAANVLEELVPGLTALGLILWEAQQTDDGAEKHELADIALLIHTLMQLVQHLNVIEVNSTRADLYMKFGLSRYGEVISNGRSREAA